MTIVEKIQLALINQGKCLTQQDLVMLEVSAPDGVPREQIVELAAGDVVECCALVERGSNRVVDELRRGSEGLAEDTLVNVRVKFVLKMLAVASTATAVCLAPGG